jgi:hypothetical protein
MAKLISPYFSQIKGSIGDTTFYDTPDNPINARSRVKPFNPSSSDQMTSRLAFAAAVGTWPALSSSQRLNYHDLAAQLKANFPSLVKTANGRSLFCRFYSIQELFYRIGVSTMHGQINIDNTYCVETPQTVGETTPIVTPGTGFTLVIYNYHDADLRYVFELSAPQRLVTNFYSAGFDFDLAQSSTVEHAAGPGDPGIARLHYTTLQPNKAYFVRIRLMPDYGDPCNWNSLPLILRAETNTVT